jgi:type IV pilus assembly protein PilC
MIMILIPLLVITYIYLGLKKPAIALITCPFAAVTIFMVGASEADYASEISAGVLLVLTIIAILFSRSSPEEINWPRVFVKYFLYSALGVLLIICMFLIFGPLGVVGVVFAVLLFGYIIAYLITSRHVTAAYVISTIGSSIRQNLPLPMAFETAISGQKDARARILSRIKYWLVQGYSLSESIKRGYKMCPGHAIAMITVAEKIDQLPQAIEAIEANMAAQAREKRKLRPVHPIYPVLVISFMLFILIGIMLFVMPNFSVALSETVGGQLPGITRFVLELTSSLFFQFTLGVVILLLSISPVIIFLTVYLRFRPRRPDEPYLFSSIGDFIKWHLPVLHWFEKNYSMVQVTEMLRLSLNAGCTVDEAIANTIGLDINCCFKERLKNWLVKVDEGQNISESAEKSKLGSALAWAFDDKVNQGNTISILETLESFYRSNYGYCVNLARFIIWPCIILLMGAVVGVVVISIFLPTVTIINDLLQLM